MVFCYCAGGRDSDECYEVALYEARKKLSWTPETQHSLVKHKPLPGTNSKAAATTE